MTDATAASSAGSEGQTLDDRYRLDALLDTGAGRSLWRATDLQNQQTVTVQVWSKETSPPDQTMATARLRQPEGVHPVFVAMEWTGRTAEGAAYAVYPSLTGRYLETWLAGHSVTAAEAVELAAELTGALATLHKNDLTHGLVSPDAIIVIQVAEGEAPTLRVVDGGIDPQPAVPHGTAVKAELARTGKVIELVASMVDATSEGASSIEALKVIAKRAQAEAGLAPIEAMAALDEAIQPLATATPGRRARGGARKVVSTMDFSDQRGGKKADAELPPLGDEILPMPEVLESQLEEASGKVDVTEAMSSLLIPASAMPPGPPPDQLLPEDAPPDELSVVPTINFTAPQPPPPEPRGRKGKKGRLTDPQKSASAPAQPAGKIMGGAAAVNPGTSVAAASGTAVGSGATGPKKRPTVVLSAQQVQAALPPNSVVPPPPPTPRATPSQGERGAMVFVVAGALVVLIALFVFVLLPQEDRPATSMEAVLIAAAEINGGAPDVNAEPEVTAAEEVAEPGPDAATADVAAAGEVAADVAADTTPETVADTAPDTVADTAPETVADTAPETVVDTAVPETVADTAVPETIAPETIATPEVTTPEVTTPETVAAPEVTVPETVAAPEVTAPEPEEDVAPPGVPAPALPREKTVSSVDQLNGALRATETVITRARTDGKGPGVITGLLARLTTTFRDGQPVTVRLRAIYYLAMKMLNEGASTSAVSDAIVQAHLSNKF